ncbi:MAG: DUF2099 family protein [archaeon]|nr:DUF2099 family protein [archaeon]
MDKHIIEMLGRSKVTIENGRIVDVTDPIVKYCPLFKKYHNIDEINRGIVKENCEFRMRKFGMCSENRSVRMKNFLSFGISEMLSSALKMRIIDAVVIAADGCGTAVIEDPEIVQGMGGRISGIIETSPIAKVINEIGSERVLDAKNVTIDQFEGVKKAFSMCYDAVAVTITSVKDAERIRECFGKDVIIIAVHTTGASMEEAKRIFEFCDIITSCASRWIREFAKERAILQVGTKVPVYASTSNGAKLIKVKLDELGREPDSVLEDGPRPLV